MKAITANWTCPECGTWIPIHMQAAGSMAGRAGEVRLTVRVDVPEAALADAFAHAWGHRDGAVASD